MVRIHYYLMNTLFIILMLLNFYYSIMLGKKISLKNYFFFIVFVYLTVIFNYQSFLDLDLFVTNYIIYILTFSIYKKVTGAHILFLFCTTIFILNFNKIIGKFADFYFSFLKSVINEETIPSHFIFLTIIFGSFIGRRISIYFNLSVIKTFFLTFICGILAFLLIYGILVGFFALIMIYSKSWGKNVFNYLLNKSSASMQEYLKSKKKETNLFSRNKLVSKKSNSDNLKKPQKRAYSSGKPRLGWFSDFFCVPEPSPELPRSEHEPNPFLDPHLNKIDRNHETHKDMFRQIATAVQNSNLDETAKTSVLAKVADSPELAKEAITNLDDVYTKGPTVLDKSKGNLLTTIKTPFVEQQIPTETFMKKTQGALQKAGPTVVVGATAVAATTAVGVLGYYGLKYGPSAISSGLDHLSQSETLPASIERAQHFQEASENLDSTSISTDMTRAELNKKPAAK